MALDLVVEKSREIRREGFELLKECYKNSSNKNFIKSKLDLCEKNIKIVSDLLENECTNGPQKFSCFYTSNQLH